VPDPRWENEFSVRSRRWAFVVNDVAASPYVSKRTRARILRRMGLEVETELIFPRCYFHTCNISVGSSALINHGTHIENVARVEIGENAALGQFTTILTSTHEIGPSEYRAGQWMARPVIVGKGCWIGARSVVLPGVTIAEGCIVAAGSVVREDCQPDGLYAGVPARRIRDLPV
jgi:acetyltransferase-like isoleucine patch superfamily enzyme